MKLNEIKPILEVALEVQTAEDLWSANAESVNEYTSTVSYSVRPISDTKPIQYEVFTIQADQQKPFGKFNAIDLAKTLQPIRPNQTPDAEGFTTYVDPQKVEAFQYTGDPMKLDLDGKQTVQLNKGDYVVREVAGSSFKFSTEAESTFESTLKKV